MRIVTFDIGKKNFAFYVEEFDQDILNEMKIRYEKLPQKLKRRVKGSMNKEIEDILFNIYSNGKRINQGVFDLRVNKDSNDLDINTRLNMFILLQEYEYVWDTCDTIVIEQQYFNISGGRRTKGSGANVDAIKLGECCMNWFLMTYGRMKDIYYFGAMYKTQMLGAPDKLTKPQRKKWAIEKGTEILELRGDNEGIELIDNFKNSKGKKQKQDDIYDCIIMTQAYKYKCFILS